MKGNTYLTAQQQVEQLGQPVDKAIVDTAKFLKEQGKVPRWPPITAISLPIALLNLSRPIRSSHADGLASYGSL